MVLDIQTELAKALELQALAQANLRTAADTLHTAGIHLSNVKDMLKPKPLPELIAYVVDNGSVGDALTTRLRGYVDMLKKSEFRCMALFQHYLQMVKDKFPQVIVDAGIVPVFDTMHSVFRTTNLTQRIEYMKQAELFKPAQYRFDDAHNNTPEELADAVKFMRGYTDAPIVGTFGADDFKLVKNPKTGKVERVPVDMQAYRQAGLLISRQFFRQEQAKNDNPTAAVDTWLKSGRITHGVDLEAFQADGVTTSPDDFSTMLAKCLNAGIDMLSVYSVVNERSWLMWKAAPELWQAVNAGAVTVRLWKQ